MPTSHPSQAGVSPCTVVAEAREQPGVEKEVDLDLVVGPPPHRGEIRIHQHAKVVDRDASEHRVTQAVEGVIKDSPVVTGNERAFREVRAFTISGNLGAGHSPGLWTQGGSTPSRRVGSDTMTDAHRRP